MNEEKGEEPMLNSLLSTVDCANRKGVSRQAIVGAIKRGVLPAVVIGGDYVIKAEDCDAYKPATTPAERGKRSAGKPKTKQVERKG